MDKKPGEYTHTEILSIPETLRTAISRAQAKVDAVRQVVNRGFDEVVLVGCGSSLYLSEAAAGFLRHALGVPARAVPASELILWPEAAFCGASNPLLVAASRSGQTTETLAAVDTFRKRGRGAVLAVTCSESGRLAALADVVISVPEADERSLVMTRSFAAMLMAVEYIAAALRSPSLAEQLQQVPALIETALSTYEEHVHRIALRKDLQRTAFLGGGPFYGVACEGMLKMKEMSLLPSEAFHPLEFRHGPKASVDPSLLVVLLVSDAGRNVETNLMRELLDMGAVGMTIGPVLQANLPLQYAVHVGESLPEAVRPLCCAPFLDLLGLFKATDCGRDPDRPAHLDRAILIEDLDADEGHRGRG
ncbi:MAG: SIS domain-containing protein [Armatimonadota bacterium]